MTTSVSKKATILKPAFAFLSLFLTILMFYWSKGVIWLHLPGQNIPGFTLALSSCLPYYLLISFIFV